MPNPAAGLFKSVAYKVEATYGTPPAVGSAQVLRRVTSTLDLTKDTYESNEIRTDMQVGDFRHGVRRVAGKIAGELSAGTWKDFFAYALKRDHTAISASSGISMTIAGAGPTYTLTRGAGSYLTDGYKVGMVIRMSVGGLNAANINKNLFIVTLTATIATVIPLNGVALVAEGPIASTTVTAIGKQTFVPLTGHTDKSFSLEHWYSDLVQSEVFAGCKINGCAIALPPTGMATVEWDVMGQNIVTAASQYFTSPVAANTFGLMAAVNGVCRIGGVSVATLTGMSVNIAPNFSGEPVVGSNTIPFSFPGRVRVTGQFTAYFDSVTLRDAFINETEIDVMAAFSADNTATSDFLAIALPRIKLGAATKNDGEGGLVQTLPFTALLASTGGAGISNERTTVQVQDSQA